MSKGELAFEPAAKMPRLTNRLPSSDPGDDSIYASVRKKMQSEDILPDNLFEPASNEGAGGAVPSVSSVDSDLAHQQGEDALAQMGTTFSSNNVASTVNNVATVNHMPTSLDYANVSTKGGGPVMRNGSGGIPVSGTCLSDTAEPLNGIGSSGAGASQSGSGSVLEDLLTKKEPHGGPCQSNHYPRGRGGLPQQTTVNGCAPVNGNSMIGTFQSGAPSEMVYNSGVASANAAMCRAPVPPSMGMCPPTGMRGRGFPQNTMMFQQRGEPGYSGVRGPPSRRGGRGGRGGSTAPPPMLHENAFGSPQPNGSLSRQQLFGNEQSGAPVGVHQGAFNLGLPGAGAAPSSESSGMPSMNGPGSQTFATVGPGPGSNLPYAQGHPVQRSRQQSAGIPGIAPQSNVPPPPRSVFPMSADMGSHGDLGLMQGGGGGIDPPINGIPHARNDSQDKIKLIVQQLVLLLHAHKCQQREKDNSGTAANCNLQHCRTMKEVLRHMTQCVAGKNCSYPHCASSRQIILHWKNCEMSGCAVCSPLKKFNNMHSNDRSGGGGEPASMHHPGNHPSESGPVFGMGNSTGGMRHSNLPDIAGTVNSFNMSSAKGDAGFSEGALRQCMGGKSQGMAGSVPNGQFGDSQLASLTQDSGLNAANDPFIGMTNHHPLPTEAEQAKPWHNDISSDLRNHLVSKLVKAIFPQPDPVALQDSRIKDLVEYARRTEKEIFEKSEDREAYYHALAEKIYKIQKELQNKRERRLREGGERQDGGGGFGSEISGPPPNASVASLEQVSSGLSSGSQCSEERKAFVKKESGVMEGGGGKGDNLGGSIGAIAHIKQEMEDAQPKMGIKVESGTVGQGAVSNSRSSPLSKISPRQKSGSDQPTVAPKPFEPDALRAAVLPVWDKLNSLEDAIPFRIPVDPELLQIPDYFDIIKKPMDLRTIRDKLNTGAYKDPWEFCQDMYLMFDNAWLYNKKNSKVYKYCSKLAEVFANEIDPVMRSLGFCCGQRLHFTPLPLYCYGASVCTIPWDGEYYCYESSPPAIGISVGTSSSEKYPYCKNCFGSLPGETVNLGDDLSADGENVVPKSSFKLLKNDQIDNEEFIFCKKCGLKWHKICANHLDEVFGDFVCKNCLEEHKLALSPNQYLAKNISQCKLSKRLEEKVNSYLKKQMSVGQDGGEVVIRVLSSTDKEVEVKSGMKKRFCDSKELPEKFPYKSKAIFAFQQVDGVELCFFGLHVQEYGSDCPKPNQRRVYIAYLDSVHFFQPRRLRTHVYHRILLAYLEYVKELGYVFAHIWACPPSEGDDYIFHCHPPEQKIPKAKRLQEWYRKMLDTAVQEHIVLDYKDIHRQANEDELQSASQVAYFEGDFWPNNLEESIKELEREEAEKEKEEKAAQAAEQLDDPDYEFPDSQGSTVGGKKDGKGKKKGVKRKKGQQSKNGPQKKGKKGTFGDGLTEKIYGTMEKHKEMFFVVRLHSQQVASGLGDIKDPDPNIVGELMEHRDNFLNMAREKHWEFSSKRRAKFSTLSFCYEIHSQGGTGLTCDNCRKEAIWHCQTCNKDLCDGCKKDLGHEHEMERQQSLVPGNEGGSGTGTDKSDSIKRCIQSLQHACDCRDANCKQQTCGKMKRVIRHSEKCDKRLQGQCPVCKQLIAICVCHAKICLEQNCQVPFCNKIKHKLAEQRRNELRKRDMELQRRSRQMFQITNAALSHPAASGPMPSVSGPHMAQQPGPSGMSFQGSQVHGGMTRPYQHPPSVTQPNAGARLEAQKIVQIAARGGAPSNVMSPGYRSVAPPIPSAPRGQYQAGPHIQQQNFGMTENWHYQQGSGQPPPVNHGRMMRPGAPPHGYVSVPASQESLMLQQQQPMGSRIRGHSGSNLPVVMGQSQSQDIHQIITRLKTADVEEKARLIHQLQQSPEGKHILYLLAARNNMSVQQGAQQQNYIGSRQNSGITGPEGSLYRGPPPTAAPGGMHMGSSPGGGTGMRAPRPSMMYSPSPQSSLVSHSSAGQSQGPSSTSFPSPVTSYQGITPLSQHPPGVMQHQQSGCIDQLNNSSQTPGPGRGPVSSYRAHGPLQQQGGASLPGSLPPMHPQQPLSPQVNFLNPVCSPPQSATGSARMTPQPKPSPGAAACVRPSPSPHSSAGSSMGHAGTLTSAAFQNSPLVTMDTSGVCLNTQQGPPPPSALGDSGGNFSQ